MTFSGPAVKKLLLAEGLEVFRVQGNTVSLADRVRDNLIMDAQIAVLAEEPLRIRVTLKAQASDFPNETAEQLFERARGLLAPLVARNYSECGTKVIPVKDPGDAARVLDTWYELVAESVVPTPEQLVPELRVALALPRTVVRTP